MAACLLLVSFSTLATTVYEELTNKSCSLQFDKTIFMRDSDQMTSLGRVTFAPLINESNLLLKKDILHPVVEFDEDVITLAERDNIIFLCVTDERDECVKLSTVASENFHELSDKKLKLICE